MKCTLVSICMVLSIILVGCGGGGAAVDPPDNNPATVVGHWNAPSGVTWDITENADGTYRIDRGPDSDLVDYVMTVTGKTYTALGQSATATWSLSGTISTTTIKVHFVYTNGATTETGDYSVTR